MLGYIHGSRVLAAKVKGAPSYDPAETLLREYLGWGSPTLTHENLGESISPGGHLDMQKLLADATVIYDPGEDNVFALR
jgi:hypothetical protein